MELRSFFFEDVLWDIPGQLVNKLVQTGNTVWTVHWIVNVMAMQGAIPFKVAVIAQQEDTELVANIVSFLS